MERRASAYGERVARGAACVQGRTVRFRCSLHNTIFDVLRYLDWIETDGDDWDFFWADTGSIHDLDHVHLQEHQRLNHFRNHYELTRKDLLIKNLKRMKKSLERDDRAIEASRSVAPRSQSPPPRPPPARPTDGPPAPARARPRAGRRPPSPGTTSSRRRTRCPRSTTSSWRSSSAAAACGS